MASSIKLLLVEDSPVDAQVLMAMLRTVGKGRYGVEHVSTIADAITRIESGFDLCLLDLSLEDGHGTSLIEHARSKHLPIPFLVISCNDSDDMDERLHQYGAVDYLVKGSFSAPIVNRAIRYSLNRSRIEVQLREFEARLRAAYENGSYAMWSVDRHGKLVSWNSGYESLLQSIGRSPDIGLDTLAMAPSDARSKWNAFYERVLAGERFTIEDNYVHEERDIFCELIFSPVFAGSVVTGATIFYKDLTERRLAEFELERAKEAAEEGSRIKSLLLANLSHEVRTPLISILGYADLLLEPVTDQERTQYANIITKGGQRLLKTLSNLLSFAQAEANAIRPQLRPVGVASVIQQVVSELEPMARSKGLSIVTNIEPAIEVIADPDYLFLAAQNVISNGLKFTDAGGVSISAFPSDHHVSIDVVDTGVGIEPQNLQKIFDPFVQESDGFNRSFEGVGIGLSLVRNYVRVMNGDVKVESRKNMGSKFTLTLPKA